MNFFKLSLVTVSLLLVGCGSDSKSDSASDAKPATSVEEAKNNMKAMGSLSTVGQKIPSNNNSKIQKNSGSEACSNGGTISSSYTNETTTISFSECKEGTDYINGTLIITENESTYNEKMEMKNLTMNSDEMNFYSKSFIVEDNEVEYWMTMDGDLKISSKCFTGNFNFKTLEKMYERQDDTDAIEKGKMELNGATYSFNYPDVTIEVGSETRTISQSQLEKEMESSTTCEE